MATEIRYTVLVKDGPSIPDWQIVFYRQAPYIMSDKSQAQSYLDELSAWYPHAEYKIAEVRYEA